MSEITHNSFTVTRSSLLVLAAEEQPVSLLLQLLRGGTLLRAAGHLLHRLRGARLALLPYPVPRLFGWLNDRFKNAPSFLRSHTHTHTQQQEQRHSFSEHSLQCTCNARLERIRCSGLMPPKRHPFNLLTALTAENYSEVAAPPAS